jgi:hypothetical protein
VVQNNKIMKVAKIIDTKIEIYDIYTLFSNVSFPDVGVPDSFLTENNLYKVVDHIENNPELQYISQLTQPILKDGVVYTVELKNRTQQELSDNKWMEIRKTRDDLLSQSDKYLLADLWDSLSESAKSQIIIYRKDLRNLPQKFSSPFGVSWPVKPSVII